MEKLTELEVRNFVTDALYHDYFEIILKTNKREGYEQKIMINEGQVWDENGKTYFPSRKADRIKELQDYIIAKMIDFETASFSNFNSEITFSQDDIDF